jgi:hypothetical protein
VIVRLEKTMFRKNIGRLDRTIRLIAGAGIFLIGIFPLNGWQGKSTGVDVALFALWPLMTGLFGFCGIYKLLGISTQEKDKNVVS